MGRKRCSTTTKIWCRVRRGMSVGSMRCFEGFDHAHTSEQQLQACDLRSPGCRIFVLCKQLCTHGATCGPSHGHRQQCRTCRRQTLLAVLPLVVGELDWARYTSGVGAPCFVAAGSRRGWLGSACTPAQRFFGFKRLVVRLGHTVACPSSTHDLQPGGAFYCGLNSVAK
jgi:hypothetical protein